MANENSKYSQSREVEKLKELSFLEYRTSKYTCGYSECANME